MTEQKLRFAPLIRVSTERQEEQGHSLRVQREQIIQYVDMLGGTIPDVCWKYSGQEHATENYERRRFDELLRDCSKDIFDAVIVTDATRYSRENAKSEEGIEIFKRHNIKFYTGVIPLDLFDPTQKLLLSIQVIFAEHQIKIQTLKSAQSRLKALSEGKPSAGKKPYGRTWSKDKGWGIDPEKHRIIQQAAKRYLSGEPMEKIAQSYGINTAGLFRTLKEKCGPKWPVRINIPRLNIDQTVTLEIPRLLDDRTIEAIHERAELNKTYNGPQRAKYLLSKYIFCAHCGYNLHSIHNNSQAKTRNRYYRHAHHKTAKECPCATKPFLRSKDLEATVLTHLKTAFGNPAKIRQAVERANPNLDNVRELEREHRDLQKGLKELEKQADRIVDQVAQGFLSGITVQNKMSAIDEQRNAKLQRIHAIEAEMSNLPSTDRTKKLSNLAHKVLIDATRSADLTKMKFDDARKLIEKIFAGKDHKGRRFGVYVHWTDTGADIELRSSLETTLLAYPLTDESIAELFHLDPKYCDIEKEITKIRNNINYGLWH